MVANTRITDFVAQVIDSASQLANRIQLLGFGLRATRFEKAFFGFVLQHNASIDRVVGLIVESSPR
jgi:tetrahydromethanopterin S-methyltransferase subunit F